MSKQPDYQKQIDKDFNEIATAYQQLRREKLGGMTHKEFEKICPQIYISDGRRLQTLGEFAKSNSTLDKIQAFAYNYNLRSQPRMDYFLQKFAKEQIKVVKIAKKATKRRELENQRSQNDNFNIKEMSGVDPMPKRKYEDQDKQKRYDDAYGQFDALLNDPKKREQIRKLYASSAANQTIKSQYGDSSLKFAEPGKTPTLKPKQWSEMNPEEWEKITKDPRNNWFQAFNGKKAVGFGFNPKMLDPEYAAWQGARRGTTVYHGDFNKDGYDDIVEIDENGVFRTINGYSRRPSKQKLYIDYYDEVEATGDASGKPYYKQNFDDWYVKKAKEMDARERKRLNEDLAKAGMAKYKVKETSVAEQIESHLKGGIYEECAEHIAAQTKDNIKLVKKNFRIKSLASHIVRAALHKYFNIDLQATQKEEEALISKLTRLVNGKLSKKAARGRETSYKDDFIKVVKEYCAGQTVKNIAVAIWNNAVVSDKTDPFVKYVNVQTKVKNEIEANDEVLVAACVNAYNESIEDWGERQQLIKSNRKGRYNPMTGEYAE